MNQFAAQDLKHRFELGEDLELIDVRTPAEFEELHVQGARNVPLDRIDAAQFRDHGDKPIYLICQKGSRGTTACRKLVDAGIAGAMNVEGGTMACVNAGLPMVRGKKTMALERQVRIAAGLLVLAGIGLSYLHPGFLGISAFVAAGLVFAGITDTCGMGMLLARMPWNQRGCRPQGESGTNSQLAT